MKGKAMKAMIMSAGKGTRVRPLSYDVPKPMFTVANKPILSYTLDLLKKHGIRDAMINLGSHSMAIKEYFANGSKYAMNIDYSFEKVLLGTAGSIKKVEKYFDDTFVVMSGDGLTDIDLTGALKFHKAKKALATIVLSKVESRFEYGIVQMNRDCSVKEFIEKPSWGEVFCDTVNTGIYILEPEIMDYIPKNKMYDFGMQLWAQLLRKKQKIYGYEMNSYWCDIGNLDEYRKAQKDVLSGSIKVRLEGEKKGSGTWIGRNARIEKGSIIEGSCIIGKNCIIKKNAKLEGINVIGDGSVIGENALIVDSILWASARINSGVKIKNCIVSSGVTVSDKTCILEKAIIRKNV